MKLNLEKVRALFETATDQAALFSGLYRMVYPDFDQRERINAKNTLVNQATWKKLCEMCMEFDKVKIQNVVPGGAWINWGFGWDDSLADWEVKPEGEVFEFNVGDTVVVQPDFSNDCFAPFVGTVTEVIDRTMFVVREADGTEHTWMAGNIRKQCV